MTEITLLGKNFNGKKSSNWGSLVPDSDLQLRIRVIAFNLALFACVPIYVAVYLAIGASISAGIVALAGVVLLCNLLLLRAGFSELVCGQLLTATAWCTYIGLALVNGGHNSPVMMWHTTVPVFAILLTGFRSGVIWSMASAIVVASMYALDLLAISVFNELTSAGLKFLEFSGLIGLMCFIFTLLYSFTLIDKVSNQRQRIAKQKAEAADRAKSEFLANMSHEIRTPMTAILGFAEVLREKEFQHSSSEHRMHAIDTIANAGTYLMAVVNDILDFSKVEAGKMKVEFVDTNLSRIMHEVKNLFSPMAIKKGLSLEVKLQSAIPERILSDPTRVRQILMNLVSNAIKFTEIGGVVVAASVEDQDGNCRLRIDIEDTGLGISPDVAANLFVPFIQADSTVNRKSGGTGLGLAICRKLAELMGGSIVLHQIAPRMGTCFRLELPIETVPGSAILDSLKIHDLGLTQNSGENSLKLSGRILLAEDGTDNQRLFAFHLRNAGAIVDIAENGRVALEMIDKANNSNVKYQLLLADMQMPEMDGYTLAKTLRDREEEFPIVALTAHAMSDDREKCLEAGCDDYVCKPVDRATLLRLCQRWLEMPA